MDALVALTAEGGPVQTSQRQALEALEPWRRLFAAAAASPVLATGPRTAEVPVLDADLEPSFAWTPVRAPPAEHL